MKVSPFELELEWRAAGIVDEGEIHSEFSQTPPLHGQKVNVDALKKGSKEFCDTVYTTASQLHAIYGSVMLENTVLVSTANGANRFLQPISQQLGITGFETVKVAPGVAHLDTDAYKQIHTLSPELVVVLDDVGSTGATTTRPVEDARCAGAECVEVLYMWQRVPVLPRLEELNVGYRAIINTPMPTYTQQECATLPQGFCSREWDVVPYKS